MSKYVKNDSGISKTYVGKQLADQEVYEISLGQSENWIKTAKDTSSNLYADINSGDLKVSVDNFTTTLSSADGLAVIQAHDTDCFKGKLIMGSPANGQLMQYDSTSDKWQCVDPSSVNIFGTQFQNFSDSTFKTTTSSSFVQHSRLTTSNLPTGDYLIFFSSTIGNEASDKQYEARFQHNDSITLAEFSVKLKEGHITSGPNNSFSGHRYLSGISGVHTFDLDFSGGSDVTRMGDVSISLWRVS